MSQFGSETDQIVCAPGQKTSFCNPEVGSANFFTGQLEIANPTYRPTLWVGVLFLSIFVLSTLAHAFQGIRRRMWWCLATFVCCGIAEILGWAGRVWMHQSYQWSPRYGGRFVFDPNAFLIQISTLIFAPAFWTAGAYITLGQIMKIRGTFYSRLRPKTYAILFICGDILSIVIQAAGGGLASAADDEDGAETGAKIMVGGIMIQVITMAAYSWILLEFIIRSSLNRPVRQWSPFEWMKCCGRRNKSPTHDRLASIPGSGTDDIPLQSSNASSVEKGQGVGQNGVQYSKRKVDLLLGALALCTILIFVRSIFRAIELLDGWSGALVADQTLFNVLDGLMVALAMVVMNIAHPGHLLPRQPR